MATREFCIRYRRPAPPVRPDQRDEWEAVVSVSGVHLGIVCPACVSECIALTPYNATAGGEA